MYLQGSGNEADEVIDGYIEQIKARIAGLIEVGEQLRKNP